MCGAPLGATDNVCGNCGTRRSEMGPAYNGMGGPSQQNSYNYGYGGNTMNGGSPGYGNYNSYGMDSTSGSYTRTRSASQTSGKLIGAIVVVILVMIGYLFYDVSYNSAHTESFGDITITFPQKVERESTSIFSDTDATDSAIYSNKGMRFAYLKYSFGDTSLENENLEKVQDLLMSTMDSVLDKKLTNYRKKDQVDNHIRFYFMDEDKTWFCDMMLELKSDSYYMYVAYCNSRNENKYASKFKKMYDSIEYRK
jgi:hypothetical protein